MRHLWFRRADGRTAVLALSLRPTRGGGVRGIGINVTDSEAAASDAASSVGWRAMLDRVVSRMRDELLTPQVLRAGLTEMVACLGAEGAAIVAARVEEGGHGAAALLLHSAGDGWDELGPQFRMPAEIGSGLEPGPVAGALAGRDLIICANPTRFGPSSALVVWRHQRPERWREDERAFTAAVASALRDAMEQDSIQREMTQQTRTDVLTGLLSRRGFVAEARRRFDRLDRANEPATLLCIDIDDFRSFNDTHGGDEGDRALCHVASYLRDTFRPTDLVCRIAADHFVAWLDGADIFAAAERAEWLCRKGAVLSVDGEPVRLGLSVGLASRAAYSLEEMDSLCRRADGAMRRAKQNGKGLWHASQQEIET
jgi:diguanylate cyclase (GGDEF)-like protein